MIEANLAFTLPRGVSTRAFLLDRASALQTGRGCASQVATPDEIKKAQRLRDSVRFKLVRRAHTAVSKAVRSGLLHRPSYCANCGTTRQAIQAAHEDYSKPLMVLWLCSSCHHRWDARQPKTKPICICLFIDKPIPGKHHITHCECVEGGSRCSGTIAGHEQRSVERNYDE